VKKETGRSEATIRTDTDSYAMDREGRNLSTAEVKDMLAADWKVFIRMEDERP